MIKYHKINNIFKRDEEGSKQLAYGVVCRPGKELFNRQSERVIVKIKQTDFRSNKVYL